MPSFSNLKNRAAKIAQGSDNDDVQALAEIVSYLARACDDLESKIKQVESTAIQARNSAAQATRR